MPAHQSGRVRGHDGPKHFGTEKAYRTRRSDGTAAFRHGCQLLHTPLLVHCQHQRTAFLKDPAGAFRRYPTVTVEEIDYHAPVNHAGIYSQALYLWKNGFHYWYENEEIATLNEVNREYSLASIEEELLYVYFRKPKADDLDVKWMPVSAILVLISMNGKIQMNDRNQKSLVQILERVTSGRESAKTRFTNTRWCSTLLMKWTGTTKRPYRQAQRRHRKNYPFKLSDYINVPAEYMYRGITYNLIHGLPAGFKVLPNIQK